MEQLTLSIDQREPRATFSLFPITFHPRLDELFLLLLLSIATRAHHQNLVSPDSHRDCSKHIPSARHGAERIRPKFSLTVLCLASLLDDIKDDSPL